MNWNELGFNYNRTGGENARVCYKDGKWGTPQFTTDEYLPIHMSAACLHYGLEAFEGLKAFRGDDGKIRLFRPKANAFRMACGARKLCLPEVPEKLFVDVCVEVVRRNLEFVPPCGSQAALYLRPLLIGTKPCLGVRSVDEAMFVVFAIPVGPYFKEGIHPINVVIDRRQDRAAPYGTGDVKVGGNYASSMLSFENAHNQGFAAVMYTDAIEHRYIEECGAANFFAIKGDKYITPKSPSILPSITNASLRILAADMGLTVEERPVDLAELPTFDECGACGTGAVISPIGMVYDLQTGETIHYGKEVGVVSLKLYNALKDLQYGRIEDKYGWTLIVE